MVLRSITLLLQLNSIPIISDQSTQHHVQSADLPERDECHPTDLPTGMIIIDSFKSCVIKQQTKLLSC